MFRPSLLRLGLLVAALVLTLPAAPARAEGGLGGRVRITILARPAVDSLGARGFSPDERIVGTLVGVDARQLVLRRKGDPPDTLVIPRPLIAEFETSSGRHARTGQGARIGLLAGTAVGIGMGIYIEKSEHITSSDFPGLGFLPITLGVGGGLGGLGLGALIGSFFHADRWRRAAPPDP